MMFLTQSSVLTDGEGHHDHTYERRIHNLQAYMSEQEGKSDIHRPYYTCRWLARHCIQGDPSICTCSELVQHIREYVWDYLMIGFNKFELSKDLPSASIVPEEKQTWGGRMIR